MTTAGRMTLAALQLEIPARTSRQDRSRIRTNLCESIGTPWERFAGTEPPLGDLRDTDSRTLGLEGIAIWRNGYLFRCRNSVSRESRDEREFVIEIEILGCFFWRRILLISPFRCVAHSFLKSFITFLCCC